MTRTQETKKNNAMLRKKYLKYLQGQRHFQTVVGRRLQSHILASPISSDGYTDDHDDRNSSGNESPLDGIINDSSSSTGEYNPSHSSLSDDDVSSTSGYSSDDNPSPS